MIRRQLVAVAFVAALVFAPTQKSQALTIVRNFVGPGNVLSGSVTTAAPGNAVGTGTLQSVFNAAADWWEMAILDSHTLTINYGWANLGGGTLGVHNLVTQGGVPNRETLAGIRFDSDGSSVWFMDGTPENSSEYTTYTETSADYGGGVVNNGRVHTGATGLAAGRTDLLSVAKHEIGHALGLSGANTSFQAESIPDNDIDVTGPRPFAGSVLPTFGANAHLNIGTSLMFPSISSGIRREISAVDILANAQVSQFTRLNLDPHNTPPNTDVPEPASLLVWALGLGFIGWRRRRRKAA